MLDDIILSTATSSPWEGGEGPAQLLFEQIEVCPIDEHLTMGIMPDVLALI